MKEIRISLNDDDFSNLCQIGYIKYKTFEIPINVSNMDELIEGKIVNISHNGHKIKIILQDIGYNRITHHLLKSKIY